MSSITFLNRHIDALDRRRSVASRVLTGHTASPEQRRAAEADLAACDDLQWAAPGAPVFIPIRSARADDAYDDYARINTPVVALTRAEADTILPPVRQFREVTKLRLRDRIDIPAWLAIGAYMIAIAAICGLVVHHAGWLAALAVR